jgi:phosphoserine phosphatase
LLGARWACATEAIAEGLRAQLKGLPGLDGGRVGLTAPPRLFISDMDSTIIGQECIDELADLVGKRAEVSAITEAAMRGELDFAGALHARLNLLVGLPEAELERCFAERVRLNAGAQALLAGLRAAGVHTVLVSGGFTFFTQRVAALAGFHDHAGNVLAIADGKLTGAIEGPLLGRAQKRAELLAHVARLGADSGAAIAIGDGANDLDMITVAGLGVAYRAKPAVAAAAACRIEATDLRAVLLFAGLGQRVRTPE